VQRISVFLRNFVSEHVNRHPAQYCSALEANFRRGVRIEYAFQQCAVFSGGNISAQSGMVHVNLFTVKALDLATLPVAGKRH